MGTLSRVGRFRLIASVAGITALFALAPSQALAGTYSWSLPGDPGTFNGANPEQKYGAPSWSYASAGPLSGPMTFSSSTWSDSAGDSIASNGSAMTLSASLAHTVSVVWTSPFKTPQPVTVTSTFLPSSGECSLNVPTSTTVGPGGTLSLTLSAVPPALGGCMATGSISISATTPSVTLTTPAGGEAVPGGQPLFAGGASAAFDASSTVTIRVYSGSSVSGSPVETIAAANNNGSYAGAGSSSIAPGTYTAQAEQDDPIGVPNLSAPVTFQVVPGLLKIASPISLSRSGVASISIGCVAPSGTCVGTVLAVTKRSFGPTPGGPTGPLLVLFAYMHINAGQTQTVTTVLPGPVARVLRRAKHPALRVTTAFGSTGATSASRRLKY